MEWKKLQSRQEKVGFKYVTFKKFKLPDGNEDEYTIWDKDGSRATGVIAITKDMKIVVARQYRPGPEKLMDELPGGFVEPGEEFKIAAERELLEETGYSSPHPLVYLGKAHKTAYSNVEHQYFLAMECSKIKEQNLDSNEHVEVDLISIDSLIENAKTGRMTDAAAVLMAYDYLLKLKGDNNG